MLYRDYPSFFNSVTLFGELVDTRLGPTREMRAQTFVATAGTIVGRPGLSLGLGFVEGLMFLGGMFDLDAIRAVAPGANLELFTAQSAYGPRLGEQLERVVYELRAHPDSRRPQIIVARHDDWPEDRPCTTALTFLLRGTSLETHVAMRSWDLWLGLPYDIMMFSVIAQAVARCLPEAVAGAVTVTAASAHVYEADWPRSPTQPTGRFRLAVDLPRQPTQLTDWAADTVDALDETPWPEGIPPGITVARPVNLTGKEDQA